MADKKRVCVIGSGNAGTTLAKIAGINALRLNSFHNEVTMYVYEEMVDDRKLTEIINEIHENVKYLPGRKLGANVIAVSDMETAAKDADIIIFVMPHKSIRVICASLLGKTKNTAIGVSLIKGVDITEHGHLEPASRVIGNRLKIQTCVLTGFAFPGEVAEDKFCETTIACKCKKAGTILRDIIQTKSLRTILIDDVETMELCVSLKTIVGCAAGFVDGLGQGFNCKAAIFRMGLIEMVKFIDLFYPNSRLAFVFESSSITDLLLSCFYGRDLRVSQALVTTGKPLEDLEQELLHGQKLGGAQVANDVHNFLKLRGVVEVFPLFHAVHRVFTKELSSDDFLPAIRSHPEHTVRLQRLGW